jgi:MarR family transcriptional regulator, negative regulator of the multidrug operon emrRAB
MHARDGNLLDALALSSADLVTEAAEQGARHGAMAPAALATIGSSPGETIDLLSQVLKLTHSGTVRLIDRLEADGLVERKSGREGRTVALFLTRAGKKALAEVLERRRIAIEGVLGSLSASERTELTRLVEKLLTAMTTGRHSAEFICRLCELDSCPEHRCPVECEAQRIEKRANRLQR